MVHKLLSIVAYAIIIFSLSLPTEITAARSDPSNIDQFCLACHRNKDIAVQLKNGEKMSLFVDKDILKESIHGLLDCSGCHSGFSASKHPGRILNNRREYTVSGSALCRNCHPTFKTELHEKMVDTAKKSGKFCVDCHGAHSVQSVSYETLRSSEYCLGCHMNDLSMTFRNGEDQSVQIDPESMKKSVHNKLYCSDCHFGFSHEEHPIRTFKSTRDYTIAAAESCRRCHFDKYTKTLESIHYAMLSQGNLQAPVCVDCHGAHAITRTGKERTWSAKRCEKCHGNIYTTYAASVHGSALFQDHNQDVPVCADCHRAHNIEDPRIFDYRENIPQMCGNCHANSELMDKYGLTTEVLNSYLQDFHGITLKATAFMILRVLLVQIHLLSKQIL
jgi:nitrate/TMAO reductase-like tetraheme cytochrome c subunit